MIRLSAKNSLAGIAPVLAICLVLSPAALVFSGCAGVNLQSAPPEVKTFFVAGREANLLGILCLSPTALDLSAYDQQMGIQYPPTSKVDVLHEPPAKPYKSFAMLECDPAFYAAQENMLEGFKHKAREIGADAIILCQGEAGREPPGKWPSRKMQAMAIKYKLTRP